EISVQFAPVIDEKSILEKNGVRIIRIKNNREIDGTWKVTHGGTKFTFTPAEHLSQNEQYKIQVTTKVKDRRGKKLAEEKVSLFSVRN
ncbi:MAG: Ig-like domain-containing protein, partial [Chryseosolibacter sp.]